MHVSCLNINVNIERIPDREMGYRRQVGTSTVVPYGRQVVADSYQLIATNYQLLAKLLDIVLVTNSGLDASSGRSSATFRLRVTLPVYLVSTQISIITKYGDESWFQTQIDLSGKRHVDNLKNVPREEGIRCILGYRSI